jgi:hypothetical protein
MIFLVWCINLYNIPKKVSESSGKENFGSVITLTIYIQRIRALMPTNGTPKTQQDGRARLLNPPTLINLLLSTTTNAPSVEGNDGNDDDGAPPPPPPYTNGRSSERRGRGDSQETTGGKSCGGGLEVYDVYDATLPVWRAGVRRWLVRSVEWESRVLAVMQVRPSFSFLFYHVFFTSDYF